MIPEKPMEFWLLAATAAGAWPVRDLPAALALICTLYAAVVVNNWRQVRGRG